MKPNSTLFPWVGAILSKAVSGFAHGAATAAGVGLVVNTLDQAIGLLKITALGGCVGAVKDVFLYINKNPMPNIFAAPTIAPVAGPVATPTIGDQPKTLASPNP